MGGTVASVNFSGKMAFFRGPPLVKIKVGFLKNFFPENFRFSQDHPLLKQKLVLKKFSQKNFQIFNGNFTLISGETSRRYNIDNTDTNLPTSSPSGGGGNVLNVGKSSSSEEVLQPVTPMSAMTTPGIYNVFCKIFVSGVTDSETDDKVYIEGTPDSVIGSLFIKEYNGLVYVNGDSSIRYKLYTRFNGSGGVCWLEEYYEKGFDDSSGGGGGPVE